MEEQELYQKLDAELEVLREYRRQRLPAPNKEKKNLDLTREIADLPDEEITIGEDANDE